MSGPDRAERRDFFISHATVNRTWAEWIAVQLEQEGYSTITQSFDFRPGVDFLHQMHQAALRADRTIAVLSPAYFDSKFSEAEWRVAFANDPNGDLGLLIPVRVQPCQPQGILTGRVYVDLVDLGETAARAKILAAANPNRPRPTHASYPGVRAPTQAHPLTTPYPGAPPRITNLPARNPHFTGRDAILDQLYNELHEKLAAAIVPTSAIHGLGGIGKTQVALEYAHRYGSEYDLVWWIDAEQPTAAAGSLTALAHKLGTPQAADQAEIVTNLLDELRQRDRWLLVYDNTEQPEQLDSLVPKGGGGHVLITSRWADWNTTHSLTLTTLTRTESLSFLRERTSRTHATEVTALDELAALLGDLPLALEEAAAYLRRTGETTIGYIDLIHSRSSELFGNPQPAVGGGPQQDQRRVATIWTLTFDRLGREAPDAEALLNLLAFLAPEIARNIPSAKWHALPDRLAAMAADPMAYNRTLAALADYSMITLTSGNITTHRLVQAVARSRQTPDQTAANLAAAIELIRAAHPGNGWDFNHWERSEQLLPHLLAITSHAKRHGLTTANLGWLLHEASAYLDVRGQYRSAEGLARLALAVTEAVLGSERAELADRHTNLGLVLQDLGDYASARLHHEQAVHISKTIHGSDHPNTAVMHNNLGNVLAHLGDHVAARAHLEDAIRIGSISLGPDHPDMAARHNNLGAVLNDLGENAAARNHYEQAIRICKITNGSNHPDLAGMHNNLGLVQHKLGDHTAARAELERAVSIGEAALPNDHPNLVRWRRNLDELSRHRSVHDNAQGPTEPLNPGSAAS